MTDFSLRDFQFSKLMLGTVQFGMPYGVANRTGQPSFENVRDIIVAAIEGGVNCFDTAAAYGTSEEVLGRMLQELRVADRVCVVTKVRALTPEELVDHAQAVKAIERSVEESRKRLRLDCLPVVLFHRESDSAYLDVLAEFRERGWIKVFGVSCDNRAGPAAELVAAGTVSALQLPGNVVDRRHQQSGVFREAAMRGIAVFIRSVYLQGLLLMAEEDTPENLRDIIPIRRKLKTVATESGVSLSELAMRYMLSQEGVTCVLAGVETVAQVRENLAIVSRGLLAADLLSEIDAIVPELSESLLTPSQWPSRRA